MAESKFRSKSSRDAFSQISREIGPNAEIVSINRYLNGDGEKEVEVSARPCRGGGADSLTGGKRVSLKTIVVIAAAGLLLSVATVVAFLILFPQDLSIQGGAERAVAIAPVRLAVLPFTDLSPEGDQQYFCDGIAEEILNRLVNLEELKVCGWISASMLSSQNLSVLETGERLNVSRLLTGSVRRSDDQLRITVQLVDAGDGFHIWSNTYASGLHNLFEIQDEISMSVLEALKLEMGLAEKELVTRRSTWSLKADDYFKRGRYLQLKGKAESMQKSMEYFSKAVEIDPNFALAYSHMAMGYTVTKSLYGIPIDEAFARAEGYIEKALSIDSTLAEPYCARGMLYLDRDFNLERAIKEFEKAIELQPNFALGHVMYSGLSLLMGDTTAARRSARIALDIDPLSCLTNESMFRVHKMLGEYSAAAEQLGRLLDLYPDYKLAESYHYFLALAGREEEAFEALYGYLEKTIDAEAKEDILAAISRSYSEDGYKAALGRYVEHFSTQIPAWTLIEYHIFLKEHNKALARLKELISRKESQGVKGGINYVLMMLRMNPKLRELESVPGFEALKAELEGLISR